MVALFGGSFDPVHLGHLRIAEDIREHFSLEKIIFIPAFISPLKSYHSASGNDRLNMLKLAIKDNPFFEISTYELDKGGISYTIDTVTYFKNMLGYNPAFIVGTDAFLTLREWKAPDDLLKNTNFIVVFRGEDKIKDVEKFVSTFGKHVTILKTNKIDFNAAAIYLYNIRKIDISSTEIRHRLKNNLSIRYLTTDEVINYIYKNNLYRGSMQNNCFSAPQ